MNRPRTLAAGLVLGAFLRAWLMTLPGTGDVTVWKVWSFAGSVDPTGVYGVGGSPPERRVLRWRGEAMTVDYPPLSMYQLAAAGRVYRAIEPTFPDSAALNVVIKCIGLVAEITMIAVVYGFARRQYGDAAAEWGVLALWLNPALLLNGSALGYLDLQLAAPLALALLAAWRRDAVSAGVLAAVAVLTKAQAIFVLPVVAATLLWRTSPFLLATVRLGAGALVTTALVVVPFVMRGAWSNLTLALSRLAAQDMLSAQATNVWWLLTWWLRVKDVWSEWGPSRSLAQETRILTIDRAMALGYPNPRLIGLAIVGAALLWACARARSIRSPATCFALGAWTMYAYALFATQVHENHLAPAVMILAPAAAIDRRYRAVFWALTGVVAANMYLFYGLGEGWPPVVPRSISGVDATVLLSLLSVLTFIRLTRLVGRPERRAPPLPE